MKILRISGRNLASLAGEFAVDFEQEPLASSGLFAISGPTGAGKSTLLDALCLALYGATPRMLKSGGSILPDVGDGTVTALDPRTLLRRGAAEAYAEVDFVGNDNLRYRARWTVRRSYTRASGALQPAKMSLHRLPELLDLSGTTNKAPIGPYRGVGRPGACFAIERTIDEIARVVGRDPLDVRFDNIVKPEQMPYMTIANLLFDNGDYPNLLKLAAKEIDLEAVRRRQKAGPEQDGRLIGVGFACYSEQTGHGCGEWVSRGSPFIPGFESCRAQLFPDGTLALYVGIQSHGQGLETTLSQIAYQELGIDPAKISVRHGDTGLSPFGNGTIASRSTVMAGGAVAATCRLLREKVLKIGAHLLQCKTSDVRCENGSVYGLQGSITIEDIARTAHLRMDALPEGVEPLLTVTGTYQPGIDTGVFAFAAHAALVAVDVHTGAVEILDYAVAEDCGTMINPMIVEGQVRGGVVQGIGTALYEEIPYDDAGQPLAGTFSDYRIPGSVEMPPIKVAHTTTPTPFTEYGVKGMGEGGAIAPSAAIANALRDALSSIGAEVNETPMTPRRIIAAIQKMGANNRPVAK